MDKRNEIEKCQVKGCENKATNIIFSHNKDDHEKTICNNCVDILRISCEVIMDKRIKIKHNDAARAKMAKVFAEDDRVRNESQACSESYLDMVDNEHAMPEWAWNVLFFILGILVTLSLDSILNIFLR